MSEKLKKAAEKVVMTRDAYSNALARLGADQDNLLNASTYPLQRLTARQSLMTSLYRNDWIAKRIVDMPAEDMTKAWITIDSQLVPDAIRRIETVMKRWRVKKKITDALKWARLYGGAAAVILLDGHEDRMDEPLDVEEVMPGSFRGLIVLDRWTGIEPGSELVTNLNDPEFGFPAYYNIFNDGMIGASMRVHHSRVLRFVGRELPAAEEENEVHWGASELEHVYDELNKRNASSANISQLIFQANLRVLKMSDLGQVLSMGDEASQKMLYETIRAQNMLMSSSGVQVLDAADSFESHAYTFTGLSEIYELFMADVAGAAEIPATKLFGRSPQGLNATGESDLTNYYESIEQKQENMLRPALDKLLPVVTISALGVLPDDLDFTFEPVQTVSEKERANLAQQTSGAIITAYTSDVIKKSTALKELRKSTAATGMWGSITDEDIEEAEQEAQLTPETDPFGMQQTPEVVGDSIEKHRQTVYDSFREEDHPRDEEGKFVETGQSSSTTETFKGQNKLAELWQKLVSQEKEAQPEEVKEPEKPDEPEKKDTRTPEERARQNRNRGIGQKPINLSKEEWQSRAEGSNKIVHGMKHWRREKYTKHANKFANKPNMTEEEYEKEAMALLSKPVGDGILGYVRSNGTIVRYDSNLNEYVFGDPTRLTVNYYPPEDGMAYYERRKRIEEYVGWKV